MVHILSICICIVVHLLVSLLVVFLSLHTYVGKRSRLHFVRGSREEAARTPKSHFETGRCPEGNGFPVSGI